jgi:hypothetical protein
MPRKTKLAERGARFASGFEEKLNADLKRYQDEIVAANVETARSFRFMKLLSDWFSDARPTFVEQYLKGLEKHVTMKEKDLVVAGQIDALYGNVIIEFESNLEKKKKEAETQLRKYFFSLLGSKESGQVSFLCVASDGVIFQVYTPWWADSETFPRSWEDVELKIVDRVDFLKLDGGQAFLWLDRYLFRKAPLHPTTEEFVRDFSINSPAYAFALKLLQSEWKRVGEKSEFKVIYENWEKYLRIAYGTSVADTELFLRHTYLATFVKLLAFMRFTQKPAIPTTKDIEDIFTGNFFQKLGIQNFLEEDFLSWIAREKVHGTLVELVQRISTLLEKYHLQELSEDVLKSLYQELVDPKDRHDLGEYYTPDWLADRIVHRVLAETPEAGVLDPACGSGSFLYFAIKYKRQRLGNKLDTLYRIRDTVVGIDIHPLAVTIAKTNYLLALGDLVKKRPRDFNIPVYMADSLRLPEKLGQPSMFEKVLSFRVELDDKEVPIPEVFTEQPAAFDEAINACETFSKEQRLGDFDAGHFTRFVKKAITEVKIDEVTAEVLFQVAKRLGELHRAQRNSIWAFILKNVYKPIFLKKKFDWIIGNPPWLSYRYVEKGKYQEFLRRKILDEYCLLQKGRGHLITHLELGTLFFGACLYEYGLSKHGQIAFVLPRSVFTADQHNNFRKTSFVRRGEVASIYQIGITEVWDLENVNPLFNVPACVVFGKRPYFTKRPIPAEILSGELARRNTSLDDALRHLTVRKSALHVVQQGDRSFWSENPKAQLIGRSPYASGFAEGATIVPRSCWFVEIVSEGALGFDPSKPYVRTDPRATDEAKEAYKDLIIEGNIEKDFLYATLLSTDLLPFGFLDYRSIVLPIKQSGENFVMITAKQAEEDSHEHLAKWLVKCEQEWTQRRKEKAGRMTIYQRLDHVRGLTQQRHTAKYKVLYPTSATNLCSAVVANEKIVTRVAGQRIVLKNFIAESKTYFFETEDENEAQFLAAILNSPTIDDLIKPMQSKGLWGPRDIHKKVWELPIPQYKESNVHHRALAGLGVACTEKVGTILPKLDTKAITPGKIGRLRNEVRKRLADELKEIDDLVQTILKK